MTLSSEYRRQFTWRDWTRVFDLLPPLGGQTVLDLGCGVGDLAAELVGRGARVIGIDLNEELLAAAWGRGLANTEFRKANLREPLALDGEVDGLWGGFIAAYFPDLPAALSRWAEHLRPGGWVALTEIDDFFGHEPLAERTRELFDGYAREALAAERYDFHMGRKLRGHLERGGFRVTKELVLADRELSFDGPADPEVVEAWRARLERMRLLRDFCGPALETLREDFLSCLTRADHRSLARVCFCLATK
ncbi:MAG TPA: class I SAM-dependent methyltransferase [Thermoanaerobaculia bacterium]|nr:class I SAM-dependent methyltransferase [Thermoanaerobaculia bacterium]